ncbi:hypothetical protein D3C83_284910 [compost metagenome]
MRLRCTIRTDRRGDGSESMRALMEEEALIDGPSCAKLPFEGPRGREGSRRRHGCEVAEMKNPVG